MDALELKMHRQNTTAFIAVNPSSLALIPLTRTRTASGGYTLQDQTPRAPQVFRIIEPGGATTPRRTLTQDGTEREVNYVLLGEWDAVMAIYDHWTTEDGREWQIGDIMRTNGYESRGLVTERGK